MQLSVSCSALCLDWRAVSNSPTETKTKPSSAELKRLNASKLREQEQIRARAEVESMLDRATSEIAREKDSAIEEVRKEFAGLAVTAAERIVERSLDAKSHSSLIDAVLKEGLNERKN